MTGAARIGAARAFLFVPGDRGERVEKAFSAGADLAIIDLEDAVAADAKAGARAAVAAWLNPSKPILVRINAAGTVNFNEDLALCAHPGVLGVVLPKADANSARTAVDMGKPVLALIESARGVADMATVAATKGVVRMAMGAIDLAGDLGLGPENTLVNPLRLQMTLASRLAEIAPPVDGVTANFRDEARLTTDVTHARALGFTGKLLIHPTQIAATLAGFSASAKDIEWARRVVTADAAAAGRAVQLDGEMVDKPIVDRARRILALV